MSDEGTLDAGDFAGWLGDLRAALRGAADADVPCGSCTACCTSSQFVHIGPDETDTLAHIPAALLFPAPRMPTRHVLLGYDERGHCPMLGDGGCSIYEHRPRTCRTYDCRVFPAAAVDVGEDAAKAAIAARAARWRFTHASERDRRRHEAIEAAARFLRAHAGELPPEAAPVTPTQLAVLAVEISELFLAADGEPRAVSVVEPEVRVVADAMLARRPS